MSKSNPFKGFHSSPEVIRLAVMMYLRFPLSLRNVEDLLHERGIDISYETIRFWWLRFGPIFAGEIKRKRVDRMRAFSNERWHLTATRDDRHRAQSTLAEPGPSTHDNTRPGNEPNRTFRNAGGHLIDRVQSLERIVFQSGKLLGQTAVHVYQAAAERAGDHFMNGRDDVTHLFRLRLITGHVEVVENRTLVRDN